MSPRVLSDDFDDRESETLEHELINTQLEAKPTNKKCISVFDISEMR